MKKISIIYDIIIYGCLSTAAILLILATIDYYNTLKEPSKIDNEVKEAIKELQSSEEELPVIDTEPNTMKSKKIKEQINIYLEELLDQTKTNEKISYEMIKSWDNFEVINSTYERKITKNYYSYKTDIKINNLKAKLPTSKNEKLSTDKYIVVTLNFNIYDILESPNIAIKSVDIPA